MTLGRSDEAGLDGTTQPGAAQPVASTHALPCVLQISGGTLGRRFELGPHGLVVGRDPENEICADLPSISRRHARLYEKEDGAWLEDLGSTNGTLVNGVPVDGPYQLRNGDQITCGGSIFKFIEGGNVEALYHEEIHRLVVTDGLTGAATKRALLEFLGRELLRAERHARPLSLVMLDIDHFKQVNDTHGHLAGDQILQSLAARLLGEVRGEELLARYGGEEFAVVLPETNLDEAARFCERIRARVEARAFDWQEQALHVTISIGAASTEPGDDHASLIARADARLYEAKRTGRNRSVLS